ncbi:uncharacterized protein METZ01_LOCUS129756, partial [marine metagenome]
VTKETSACLKAEVKAKLPIPPKIPTAANIPRSNKEVGIIHPPNGIVNNEAIKAKIVKYKAMR